MQQNEAINLTNFEDSKIVVKIRCRKQTGNIPAGTSFPDGSFTSKAIIEWSDWTDPIISCVSNQEVTAVEDLRAEIEMLVYPNPTSDFISLNFAKIQNFDKISYTITDFSGRVLQTAELKTDLVQINFLNYAVGNYFITVQENNQLIKTFKIIKN